MTAATPLHRVRLTCVVALALLVAASAFYAADAPAGPVLRFTVRPFRVQVESTTSGHQHRLLTKINFFGLRRRERVAYICFTCRDERSSGGYHEFRARRASASSVAQMRFSERSRLHVEISSSHGHGGQRLKTYAVAIATGETTLLRERCIAEARYKHEIPCP